MTDKHPGGRPPLYTDPAEMQMIIDDYFGSKTWTDDNGTTHCRPTMAGLARALGMCRQTLLNYAEKDEFLDTIKEARLVVEEALEDRLYDPSPTGVIFNLKNNFDWKDKTEQELTGKDGEPLNTIINFTPVCNKQSQ